MNNSVKSIDFFVNDMVRIVRHTLRIEKSFYKKNMDLNSFAIKKINEMINLILRKHEFKYEYDIEYVLSNVLVRITISWENQNFDKYSDYYNVYDFDNHFGDVLNRLAQAVNDEYDMLLCTV